MRASIRRVAEAAGVSSMTVSNVINNRTDQMTRETLNRVTETIRTLNYVPVRTATQNRTCKTNAIGVTFLHRHAPHGDVGSRTFQGICRRAREIDHDLTLFLRSEPTWARPGSEQQFLDRRCDGFIFIGGNQVEISEALVRQEVPVVECFSVAPATGVARILGDNVDAMRQAVAHLAEHAHQRIAFLSGPLKHLEAQQRLDGFRRGMRESFGVDYQDFVVEANTWGGLAGSADDQSAYVEQIRPFAEAILQMGVTAVACANDRLALAIWQIAEEAGLSVPRDLSLVGMDNIVDAAQRGLTSVATPFEEIGEAAVDAIVALQSAYDSLAVSRVLPVNLIRRGSVMSPR